MKEKGFFVDLDGQGSQQRKKDQEKDEDGVWLRDDVSEKKKFHDIGQTEGKLSTPTHSPDKRKHMAIQDGK